MKGKEMKLLKFTGFEKNEAIYINPSKVIAVGSAIFDDLKTGDSKNVTIIQCEFNVEYGVVESPKDVADILQIG